MIIQRWFRHWIISSELIILRHNRWERKWQRLSIYIFHPPSNASLLSNRYKTQRFTGSKIIHRMSSSSRTNHVGNIRTGSVCCRLSLLISTGCLRSSHLTSMIRTWRGWWVADNKTFLRTTRLHCSGSRNKKTKVGSRPNSQFFLLTKFIQQNRTIYFWNKTKSGNHVSSNPTTAALIQNLNKESSL